MLVFLLVLSLLFITPAAFSQEIKPLYTLPEKKVTAREVSMESDAYLIGSDEGLFKVSSKSYAVPLWTDARVDQIIKIIPDASKPKKAAFYIRTRKGIFYTEDLVNFEERDKGLPFLTIKKYDGKTTKLDLQIQSLKDLCINPVNNKEMVTATKDAVFYTQDGGASWRSLGSMGPNTSGNKAVAVLTIDEETVVFMSHPLFGFSYIFPNRKNAHWNDISAGFEIMKSLSSPDEMADLLPVVRTLADGTKQAELYVSQSYIPRIYKFNWYTKRAELLYKGDEPVETIDGLYLIDNVILYTKLEGFGSLNLETNKSNGVPKKVSDWEKAFSAVPGTVNTAYIPESKSGFGKEVIVNELWELYPGSINTKYAKTALDKKSIYASAYQCRLQSGIDKYKKLLKDKKMNSIVIDMKDDAGYLRYDSKDPVVKAKGKVSSYKMDLDKFVSEFKKDDVYLVARIVVFKDPVLASYGGGKYAVWDKTTNAAWKGTRTLADGTQGYYDEVWVDPYCQEVWEYDVAIAKELVERGFDEIQFDYIRFPTDGRNLYNAQYRWQDKGMDKESALISFLSYARENINAPLGIDIYGANGWYRCGSKTGQDVEMLCEYVDVIGPMFYPSHFEQKFLNYEPFADRTYRIYYYGSYRNTVMARNRAIIRPWVQCFYLNVSYDNAYYDTNYIKKEFFGVRDALNRGYMCWNNSGDYSKTPEDVKDSDEFIGTAPEAAYKNKPAIGTRQRDYNDQKSVDMAILNLLRGADNPENSIENSGYKPYLLTPLVNVGGN